ncbi:MAG: hypothetical protein IPL82_06370 [Elusimicrobia bacterium]|nr:hypothetical protein [Elusimicrobiota bacterium]
MLTDKAYRFTWTAWCNCRGWPLKEEERIRKSYEDRIREVQELMQATSKTLSVPSNYTGL